MPATPRKLLIAVVALASLPAAAADAATRYAKPNAQIALGACLTPETACPLGYAIDQAYEGDVVEVGSGTYSYTGTVEVDKRMTLRGAPGERPLLESTDGLTLRIGVGANGARIEHLRLRGPASSYALYGNFEPVTVRDVDIDAAGACASFTVALVEDVTMRTTAPNTICTSLYGGTGTVRRLSVTTSQNSSAIGSLYVASSEDVTVRADGNGISSAGGMHRRWDVQAGKTGVSLDEATLTDALVVAGADGIVGRGRATVRNVSVSAGEDAVFARGEIVSLRAGDLTLTNVIARGGVFDLKTELGQPGCDEPPCSDGKIVIDHSFARMTSGPNIAIGDAVRVDDPLFVSATDLHLQPGSPARDAGAAAGVDGSATDVDGEARVQGAAPEIGGDELASVVPAPAPPAPAPPVAPAPKDTVAPGLGNVVGAAKGKLLYALTEAATVSVKVERQAGGKKKGKACVRPTTKLKRAKSCKRHTTVGTVLLNGAVGANSATLRPAGKALKKGTYRVTVIATDLAGNAARPQTVTLKV